MKKTVCTGAICEVGGNDTCCHECEHFGECVDNWKCGNVEFYKECKGEGGACIVCAS